MTFTGGPTNSKVYLTTHCLRTPIPKVRMYRTQVTHYSTCLLPTHIQFLVWHKSLHYSTQLYSPLVQRVLLCPGLMRTCLVVVRPPCGLKEWASSDVNLYYSLLYNRSLRGFIHSPSTPLSPHLAFSLTHSPYTPCLMLHFSSRVTECRMESMRVGHTPVASVNIGKRSFLEPQCEPRELFNP